MFRIFRPLQNFSTNKQIYKPLIPLLDKYNVIYSHPNFADGSLLKNYSVFFYMIPAGLMAVNNYLMDWNLYRSTAFVALLATGLFLKSSVSNYNSTIVQCVQVNPDLQKIYLTVQLSPLTLFLLEQYGIHKQQFNQLLNSYHPLKIKNPQLRIVTDYNEFQQKNMKYEDIREIRKIQSQIGRLCIPIKNMKFKIDLQPNQLPIYQRDIQRLTPKQMMKKYENYKISLQILFEKYKKNLPFQFKVTPNNNINKRYQDYLLALAIGYDIDVTGNPKTEMKKSEEKNTSQQQLKKSNQEKDGDIQK